MTYQLWEAMTLLAAAALLTWFVERHDIETSRRDHPYAAIWERP